MRIFHVKRRTIIFILLPLFLISGIWAGSAMEYSSLQGRVIVVDAGHGGIDPGANRPGVNEKDINLEVALKLKEILNSHGAKVILSRDTDVDLSEQCDNPRVKGRYHRDLAARLELVEESNADIFISIHANSSGSSKRRGAETFYAPKSDSGKILANAIQTELHKSMRSSEKANPGNYFVLKRNKVPAALVEVGYITNPEERQLLYSPEHQQNLAAAIALGITHYYNQENNPVYRYIVRPINKYQNNQ